MGTSRKKLTSLEAIDKATGEVAAIIETPKGCRNKFDYDEDLELFKLAGLLAAGSVFPYDFGFIPSTRGGDGDPLDLLVLMDESTFTGCYLKVRLVGVIVAEQTEKDGETTRNDRLIAVSSKSQEYATVDSIDDLNSNLVKEIEHFFVSYNAAKGRVFKPLGAHGPDEAMKILKAAMAAYSRRNRSARTNGSTRNNKKTR
jgi:inorganic pyrophosphatase